MKNQTLIHSLAIATVLGLVGFFGFSYFEPGLLSAQSTVDDDDIIVTQVVEAGISISDGDNITLTPLSTANHMAVGSTNWTVITNASTGYNLTVHSSANGLYNGTVSFTNIGQTFNTWTAHTNTNGYYWGFRAFGTHVDTGDHGTANQCGDGADNPQAANQNWRGFDPGDYSDPIQIAHTTTLTPIAGVETNFCIGTEQTGVFAPSGTYTATITATATVNP